MNKEKKRKYIFAQLNSLPNAFQYVEVTNYIKSLEEENNLLKEQRQELRNWLEEQEEKAWDEVSSTFGYVLDKLNELENKSAENGKNVQ